MIHRYELHISGITYQAQGYSLDELGTLPTWLIDDHTVVHKFVMDARKDAKG